MSRLSILVMLVGLLGCRGKEDDTGVEGTVVDDNGPLDVDGDGYDSDVDCDDFDAEVNPGVEEECDGIDNDCDNQIDEDLHETYYADVDEDGFGDPLTTEEACEPPDGYVPAGEEDCDDANADVNPGAEEVCDGLDNNCDDEVDEGATDAETWYLDADHDGYGDAVFTTDACDQPAGYVTDATDCDDTDGNTFPGAAERCDELDNDCDEEIDEDVQDVWYTDADGDGYGDVESTYDSCDPPDGYVEDATDCNDAQAASYPGNDEICDEIDNDCDEDIDEEATDATTWYIDVDEDGYGDPETSTTTCDAPSGYIDDDNDCDDTNGNINPDATEVCDEQDNDCDGDIDDDDDSVSDQGLYYVDADGDGYGSDETELETCDPPTDYVTDAEDCDDADGDVNPDATEVCDDVDNDCDGSVDDDDSSVDTSTGSTWYVDEDEDGYGNPDESMLACDQPSGYVSDDSDCDDEDPTTTDENTYYADDDDDGYGDASSTTTDCDVPTGYVEDDSDCDDGDSSVNPGEEEVCSDSEDNDCDGDTDEECPEEHCGYVSSDETWDDNDGYGHIVTCNIYVSGSSGPVLTIEEGANVYFEENTVMYVGYPSDGDLVVDGGTDGVLFTSAADTPDAGDWYGLYFYYYTSDVSEIDGLTIEYAGSSYGNLYNYDTDLSITNSTFRHSASEGIWNVYGEPTISDSTFEDNVGVGYYCQSSTCLDETAGSFYGNTLTANGDVPIRLYANNVASLDSSNTFVGNDEDFIQISGGSITQDSSWEPLDVPYYLDSDLSVYNASTEPTLTLEDGVEIYVDEDEWIYVGTGPSGNLVVDGHTEGVLITSAAEDPEPGDWYGIYLGYYSDENTVIDGLTVEYAGGNSSYPAGIFIYYNQGDSVTISNSTIQNNAGEGIYAYYYSTPIITGTTIQDNESDGLYVMTDLGGDFEDNVVTGNGGHSVVAYFKTVGMLDASSSYEGNEEETVKLMGGVLAESATVQDIGVPFEITSNASVYGAAAPVLTVEDGVEMLFAENSGLFIGNSTYGDLVVEGDWDSGEGVLFSASEGSVAGSWDGLYLGYYSSDDTVMNGFTLEYGGGSSSYVGGIYMYGAEPTLSDCEILDNAYYGIYDYYYSTLSMSDCTVSGTVAVGSSDGIGVDASEIDGWSNNVITDNDGYAVVIPGDDMVELDEDSTYSGNGIDFIKVDTYYAMTSGTWGALDVPFYVDNAWGYLTVYGSSAVPVEIVAEGTEIYFAEEHILYVGWSGAGDIYADGLVLTSAENEPEAGDWNGLILGYHTSDSTITNSEVSYGGANTSYPGNISCYYCTAEITDTLISDSLYYGVYAVGTYTLDLSGNTYTDNALGDAYPDTL